MTATDELDLIDALVRARQRGLVREFPDFEAFAAAVLLLIDEADTPENRAALQIGTPGRVTSLIAGATEFRYAIAIVPPTVGHLAGEQFVIQHREEPFRTLVVVVSPEQEQRIAAQRTADRHEPGVDHSNPRDALDQRPSADPGRTE